MKHTEATVSVRLTNFMGISLCLVTIVVRTLWKPSSKYASNRFKLLHSKRLRSRIHNTCFSSFPLTIGYKRIYYGVIYTQIRNPSYLLCTFHIRADIIIITIPCKMVEDSPRSFGKRIRREQRRQNESKTDFVLVRNVINIDNNFWIASQKIKSVRPKIMYIMISSDKMFENNL